MAVNDFFIRQLGAFGSSDVNSKSLSVTYPNVQVADPKVDEVWAKAHSPNAPERMDSYFDYFFSGQDIIVTIDGLEEEANLRVMPIINLGFNITQNKMPVYGYNSYTYDAVLRGTRIINGSFTIATKYPNYMKDVLSQAAKARQENQGKGGYYYYQGLTDDDANIEQFWTKTLDPAVLRVQTNIFSVHPPFSFVIIYGVQNISMSPTFFSGSADWLNRYENDNAWATDVNERLIESDVVNQSNRIVLDDCELMSVEMGFGSDGSVLTETYSFICRDVVIP